MRTSEKALQLLSALRLWYNNPTAIEILPSQLTGIKSLIPNGIVSSSYILWNYPTQLCVGCGNLAKDYKVGFSSLVRYRCGECTCEDFQPSETSEILRRSNTYTWGKVEDFIRYAPQEFYIGEQLEAFIKLNAKLLNLHKELECLAYTQPS